MLRTMFTTSMTAGVATVFLLATIHIGSAQVRSSTNFQIQSDSINTGGGFSGSASFELESTVGEIATGRSTSTNFELRAGYQQMQEVFISITDATDVVMSPNIGGLTGGTANGSTSVRVITDSPAGYQLTITSANAPAMQSGGNTIADFDTSAPAEFSFVVPSGARFGFSPEGPDIISSFRDNGSVCGTGSLDTSLACWSGLTTGATVIAQGTDANHPNGATTTVRFRVGVAPSAGIPSGLYTATSTMTALPL